MADQSLDKQTRQVDKMKPQNGNDMEVLQRTQNQFLAIQAERKQNLAQQRTMMGGDQAQAELMQQAAQLGAQGGDRGIPQTVDPRTQAVMSKYGMGKPRFQKTQQHTQQVTKQNVTIHNTTNNTTTNNVNAGGPVGGRALSVKSMDNSSTEKFKIWLTNSYAKQQQQALIRNREYEKREESLTRSSNRMMRKLEGLGKNIAKVMDPRRIGQTLVDPLKMLFMFMGFHLFIKNFKKILGFVDKIEKKAGGLLKGFGLSIDDKGEVRLDKNSVAGAVDEKLGWLGSMIVRAFGGDPTQGDRVGTMIERILIGDEQHYGLWMKVKDYFEAWKEERAAAMRGLDFPDLTKYLETKDYLGGIGEVMKYLGNLVTVGLSGAKGLGQVMQSQSTEAYNNTYEESDAGKEARGIVTNGAKGASGITDKQYQAALHKKLDKATLKTERQFNKDDITEGKKLTDAQKRNNIQHYLGDEKIKDLSASGLHIDYATSEINKNGSAKLVVFDEIGHQFSLDFNEKSVYQSAKFNGNLYDGAPDKQNVFTGEWVQGSLGGNINKMSDLNISDKGNNTLANNEIAAYKQTSELADLISDAKDGKFNEKGFAFGMERMQKYLLKQKKDNFIPVKKKLLTQLGITDSEIAEYTKSGSIKTLNFYRVKRKANVKDISDLLGVDHPIVAALKAYANTAIHTETPGWGDATAIKEYGLALGIGAVVGGALLALTPIGWVGALAWGIGLATTTVMASRSEAVQAAIAYKMADMKYEDLPQYIGDIVSEEVLQVMRRGDAKAESMQTRPFNVHLVSQNNTLTFEGFSEAELAKARMQFIGVQAWLLKQWLAEKTGTNQDPGRGLKDNFTDKEVENFGKEDYAHKVGNALHALAGDKDFNTRTQYRGSYFSTKWTGQDTEANAIKEQWQETIKNKQEVSDKNDAETKAAAQEHYSEQQTYYEQNKDLEGMKYLTDEAYMKLNENEKIAYVKAALLKAMRAHDPSIDEDTVDAIVGTMCFESHLDPHAKEIYNNQGVYTSGPLKGMEKGGQGIHGFTAHLKKWILNNINAKRRAAGKPEAAMVADTDINEQIAAFTDSLYTKGASFGPQALKLMKTKSSLREKVIAWVDTYGRGATSTSWACAHPDEPTWKDPTWVSKDKLAAAKAAAKANAAKQNKTLSEKDLDDMFFGTYADGTKYVKDKSISKFDRNRLTKNEVVDKRYAFAEKSHNNEVKHSAIANAVGTVAEGLGTLWQKGKEFFSGSKETLEEEWNRIKDTEAGKKFIAEGGTMDSWIAKGKKLAEDARDNIKQFFKTTKTYHYGNNNVYGPEYSNYDAYLRDNGNLPAGLSQIAWEEEVKRRTGYSPYEITWTSKRSSTVNPTSVSLSQTTDSSMQAFDGISKIIQQRQQENAIKAAEAQKKREEEEKAAKLAQLSTAKNTKDTATLLREFLLRKKGKFGAEDTENSTSNR